MTQTEVKTKKFTLMELFSIVDGRLSNSGMDGVYDVLEWVSGNEGITTIGLVMVQDQIKAQQPKPKWWIAVATDLAMVKEKVGDKFEDMMKFIEEKYNPTYDIPSGN